MKANNTKKNWAVGNFATNPTDPQIHGECCLINMTECEVRKYMRTAHFEFPENYAVELSSDDSCVVITCKETWSRDKGLVRKFHKQIRR